MDTIYIGTGSGSLIGLSPEGKPGFVLSLGYSAIRDSGGTMTVEGP